MDQSVPKKSTECKQFKSRQDMILSDGVLLFWKTGVDRLPLLGCGRTPTQVRVFFLGVGAKLGQATFSRVLFEQPTKHSKASNVFAPIATKRVC